MSDLQILQNRAARTILDLEYRSSASFALKKLNWKDLKSRRIINRLVFTYKCKNDLFSFNFEITHHQDMHTYNTRSKCDVRKLARNKNGDTRQRLTLPVTTVMNCPRKVVKIYKPLNSY